MIYIKQNEIAKYASDKVSTYELSDEDPFKLIDQIGTIAKQAICKNLVEIDKLITDTVEKMNEIDECVVFDLNVNTHRRKGIVSYDIDYPCLSGILAMILYSKSDYCHLIFIDGNYDIEQKVRAYIDAMIDGSFDMRNYIESTMRLYGHKNSLDVEEV